ncbi:hypothetical protein ACFL3T_03165 [Patescibacteria group bacterium]
MKTKIKLLIIGALSIATMLTASVAVADYGATNESSSCPGGSCQDFHNDGISFNGPYGTGLSFPSFNNYYNYPTEDGRLYDERQFVYIEKARAQFAGMPYPSPWDNYPSYQFDQDDIRHELYFSGDPNETKKFGLWIYMHNNAIGGDDIYAKGVGLKVDHWGSSTPQTSFSPRALISADNTKPRKIWADVDITSNGVPFTLQPVDAHISKLEGYGHLAPADLTSLTHEGVTVRTGSSKNGWFNSSQDYYVVIYLEFEATPEPPDDDEPGYCNLLEIVRPTEADDGKGAVFVPATITVDEPLVNEPLEVRLDSDPNVIEGYRYYVDPSKRGGITISETPGGPGSEDLVTTSRTVYLNGLPNPAKTSSIIRITAINDINDEESWELPCGDSIKIIYQPDTEPPECKELKTNPGKLNTALVELNNWVPIVLEGPTDTDNNPFMFEGEQPLIKYCYSNTNIDFRDSIWVTSPQCAIAPANVQIEARAQEQGTMTIDVLDTDVAACADSYETEEHQYGGVCLDLDFRPQYDVFDTDEEKEYCVDINVETTVQGYNNEIEWNVIRDGEIVFSTNTQGDPCIDFDDFNFPGSIPEDILEAKALIEYNDEDCEDEITSPERECERFRLEEEEFERGRDNEICVDDTDWPVQSTGVYVSVDGDDEFLVDVDEDDCFIIEEEDLEGADHVEVWVPEWEDECNDDLDRVVYPPQFDKNVKDEDAGSASFSSRAAINFSDNNVDYRIMYEHRNDEEQDVTITDTIGRDGYIQGYIASTMSDLDDAPEGGRIYYDEGSMEIWVEGEGIIEDCDDTSDDLCYNGDIGDRSGVEIENVPPRREVLITYSGDVDTVVSPSNCSDQDHDLTDQGVCGEIYPNVARFDDEAGFDENDKDYNNEAEVIIPCPFIIVRSGGEVFLENPFDYGVDTLSCSEIENVPVPIIRPDIDTPDLVKSGEGESILSAFSDRLCKDKDQEIEGYEDIERISSLICEITLKTSDDLTQFAIVQNIARNIDLFARYDRVLDNKTEINGSNSLPDSSSKVYVKKNTGKLKLGGEFSNGAQTIVVIGGDVEITEDIKFRDPSDLTDPRQIPSLALIVIGGDILVAPGVEETNGVFFVQEGENGEGGRMCEGTCAENEQYNENPLVHYGSIYGDIQHLFKYRTFAGDPTKEEAAILIRFDNRIYLNTPPILGELVNVTSEVF